MKNYNNISKRVLRKLQRWTSGFDLTSKEFKILKKQDFECYSCGKNLIKDYDFPYVGTEALCEDCHTEQNYTVCDICEEYFENLNYPTDDEHIYINRELSKEQGYETGIYKVLRRPFFYGSILTGFDAFFANSLELVKSIDLDKYYEILHHSKDEIKSGMICPKCVKKFTNTGFIKPLVRWNPREEKFKINTNQSINIRALIKG